MIKMAFQVPFAYMHHQFGNMDFALCDFVLKNQSYCDYYAQSRREVILDNSIHELGESLSLEKLEEAFFRIEPRWVIPPDYMFNAQKTLQSLEITESIFPKSYLLPVIQATTIADFVRLQDIYISKGYTFLAVPYRLKRSLLLNFLRSDIQYHFLGLISPEEFRYFKYYPMIKSIDTGKPFRKNGKKLDMNSTDLDLEYIVSYIDTCTQNYSQDLSSSPNLIRED